MAPSVSQAMGSAHRMLSDIPPATMAKADLRKVEADYRKRVGECIARARKSLGWTLKELGAAVERVTGKEPETAQLSRWEAGTERPHFDALLAVPEMRGPLVIALARLSDEIEVSTTIQIRRSA